jgi:uncharacterized protein (UPF0264 family)
MKIKLLISPRTIEEALVTIRSGADYIDCKNPSEGSLGANFPWIIKEMKSLIPINSDQKLSATIGDFPFLPGSGSLAALGATLSGADIIKVGLKGAKNQREGIVMMKNIVKAVKDFKNDALVVAAGYADFARIHTSPPPNLIPSITAESSADIAMLDTCIKDGKGLFDFLSVDDLIKFKEEAKDSGLKVALAGNLSRESIPDLKIIKPDIIGVRSVVCERFDRLNGEIKLPLIKALQDQLYN